MKRFVTVLIFLGVVVVAVLAALQWSLERRFRSIVREELVPDAEKMLGVDVDVANAGLSLLGRSLYLDGITAANPPGFTDPKLISVQRLRIHGSLRTLLSGSRVAVARLHGTGLRIALARNADGQLNLDRVGHPPAPGAPTRTPSTIPVPGITPLVHDADLPRGAVQELAVDAVLSYVDHSRAVDGGPFALALKLDIRGENITFGPGSSDEWGTLAARGALASDPDRWVTRIDGRVATLADPARASFDLAGHIDTVDPADLQPYLGENKLTCEELDIKFDLSCRQGRFDPQKSTLSLSMRDVTLGTNLVAHLPEELRHMDSLVLPLPVGGTLAKPRVDIEQAAMAAALETLKRNPGLLMKAAVKGLLLRGGGSADQGGSEEDKGSTQTERLLKDLEDLL